jgi:hypothetical protein
MAGPVTVPVPAGCNRGQEKACRKENAGTTRTKVSSFVRILYGTIGPVKDHRIRLTDEDLSLILAALRARAAMAGPMRSHRIERLYSRLAEATPGNPKWRLDEFGQTHEEDLAADDD